MYYWEAILKHSFLHLFNPLKMGNYYDSGHHMQSFVYSSHQRENMSSIFSKYLTQNSKKIYRDNDVWDRFNRTILPPVMQTFYMFFIRCTIIIHGKYMMHHDITVMFLTQINIYSNENSIIMMSHYVVSINCPITDKC